MKKKFTGKCVCKHSWDDHHHGCIQNPQCMIDRGDDFRNVDGMLGQECEATQFEGMFTPNVAWITYDKKGKPHKHHKHYKEMCNCNVYWDKGWGKAPEWRKE